MTNSQRLATVRAHLLRWLSQFAGASESGSDQPSLCVEASLCGITSESILICEGFYAGRTFHLASNQSAFQATWFMEQDELKIRSERGDVLAVFQGAEIDGLSVTAAQEDETISIPMPTSPQRPAADDDQDQSRRAA